MPIRSIDDIVCHDISSSWLSIRPKRLYSDLFRHNGDLSRLPLYGCRHVSCSVFSLCCGCNLTFPYLARCSILLNTPSPRINPADGVRRIAPEIDSPFQPNRIRRYEPANVRIVIAERVVVQPRVPIQVLPLEPQVLLPGFVLGLIACIKRMRLAAIGLDQLPFLSLRIAPGLVGGLPDELALGIWLALRFAIRRPAASRSSSVRCAPAACAVAAPESEAFPQRGGGF